MSGVKWALLCGVNYYFDGAARSSNGSNQTIPNLTGCVNDVRRARRFLLDHGVKIEKIKSLTASPSDAGPKEEDAILPTWENVKKELEYISQNASKGDLVYFHFSGHGVRRKQLGPGDFLGGDDDGDPLHGMALVMTDVLRGKPYLTGYHLGVWIQDLVKIHGLRVTVVLDSCFSGSQFRHGTAADLTGATQPRTILDWSDDSWLPSDATANDALNTKWLDDNPSERDAYHVPRLWLSEPEGCTVLTACGPNQVAREAAFGPDNQAHGLLTYWILQHVQNFVKDQLPSHRRMLNHAIRRIQSASSMDQQTPMIVGDGHYEFFGANIYFEKAGASVLEREGSIVVLDVGSAQGVAVNALYELVSSNLSHLDGQNQTSTQARVFNVSQFSSEAILLEENPEVDESWLGILRQWAFAPEIRVALRDELESHQTVLQTEFKKVPGLVFVNDVEEGTPVDYTIRVSKDQRFEIYAGSERLPRLPPISLSEKQAIQKLTYVTSHVARFRALRAFFLSSPTRRLPTRDFEFNVEPAEVEEGEEVELSVSYRGSSRAGAWISTFCFTPSWGIVKLDPVPMLGSAALKATGDYVPDEFDKSPFIMEIPPSGNADDPLWVEDLFMVFASNGDGPAVAWDDICLPSLPADKPVLQNMLEIQQKEFSNDRNIRIQGSNRTGWTSMAQYVTTIRTAQDVVQSM